MAESVLHLPAVGRGELVHPTGSGGQRGIRGYEGLIAPGTGETHQ